MGITVKILRLIVIDNRLNVDLTHFQTRSIVRRQFDGMSTNCFHLALLFETDLHTIFCFVFRNNYSPNVVGKMCWS